MNRCRMSPAWRGSQSGLAWTACGPGTGCWPARLGELSDEAGRTRPGLGICLHVALSARPAAGLAGLTAGTMQAMYGVPADRARQLAIAGTPSQVATHLARYSDAGAQLIAVTCDPGPSAESWELLAETQRLLNQR